MFGKLDSCYKYGYNCVMENIVEIRKMLKFEKN